MTHSPTHEALKSMREWMALFIHATKLDPAKTSITFRGPGRHMPLNVKLQEILDLADKALFAEEYPLIELNGPDEAKPASDPLNLEAYRVPAKIEALVQEYSQRACADNPNTSFRVHAQNYRDFALAVMIVMGAEP